MTARLILSALLFLTPLSGASAQTNPDELPGVERRLKDRAEEEKQLRREAEAREKEVTALRHRLIETANSLQEAEKKITGFEASIEALETEKAEAEKALRAESNNLSDVLAGLQSLELSKPPALLVSPQDANKAARAAMLLSEAAPAVEARAARLRQAIERLATLSKQLDQERTAYTETNRALSARRDVLADLMAKKEQERDVAASLASAAQKETARLAVKATSLREMVQRLERLAHLVTPRLKPPAPKEAPASPAVTARQTPTIKPTAPTAYISTKNFAEAVGKLRAPVAGKLTGQFGKARPEGGVHEGIRLAARDKAIVIAPFEGRVIFAREWQPIGNLVMLDVGGGYHILLLGVDDILVEENQRVAAGEPVAQMAQGGAELDLQIRKDREPVNPVLWLSSKSRQELAF